jgi:hypothetical protein
MTDKGFKGSLPILDHLAPNGLVVGDEFREGTESPASRNLAFITNCVNPIGYEANMLGLFTLETM